ncbi:MAG: 30S ribosomal protein S7 [bacterium]|nr:30S ribosomal protein S7 [bacterium]
MRKKQIYKNRKLRQPDIKFNSLVVGRFINYLMFEGKKSLAEKIVYQAFEQIEKTTKEDPMKVFEKALENVSPLVAVASRRVGGANYQVPMEVRPERKFFLAGHWIIAAARARKGRTMVENLAEEIIAASKNEGTAVKKKQDMHRVAEANRAFAHFAR